MSDANVRILERVNEAFNRGDIEALLGYYAPDAEFIDRTGAPDQPTVARGRDEIRKVAELWTSEFEEFGCDVEEYFGAGDFVVCTARWRGVGRASGAVIDLQQFDVYELNDGRIVRAVLGYRTRDEALKAAGIAGSDVG